MHASSCCGEGTALLQPADRSRTTVPVGAGSSRSSIGGLLLVRPVAQGCAGRVGPA